MMDWSEEPWVKLYTRETTTMAMLPWESRAVLHELMKRASFDGVISLGRNGVRGLAALIRVPEDVVERALGDLAGEDIVSIAEGCESVLIVNFYEAQKARTSDKERKRRSRESKAAETKSKALDAKGESVTARHSPSQPVTNRIEEKRREETRSPPTPPGGDGSVEASPMPGLWERFDPGRASEYLDPLWQAWGDGHPQPGFRDQAKLAERLQGWLSALTPEQRADRLAKLVAWTRRKFAPQDKVRDLLHGDWGGALAPPADGESGGPEGISVAEKIHRQVAEAKAEDERIRRLRSAKRAGELAPVGDVLEEVFSGSRT